MLFAVSIARRTHHEWKQVPRQMRAGFRRRLAHRPFSSRSCLTRDFRSFELQISDYLNEKLRTNQRNRPRSLTTGYSPAYSRILIGESAKDRGHKISLIAREGHPLLGYPGIFAPCWREVTTTQARHTVRECQQPLLRADKAD